MSQHSSAEKYHFPMLAPMWYWPTPRVMVWDCLSAFFPPFFLPLPPLPPSPPLTPLRSSSMLPARKVDLKTCLLNTGNYITWEQLLQVLKSYVIRYQIAFNTFYSWGTYTSLNTDDARRNFAVYCRLLKIYPWAMNLGGCSKRGVGVFLRTLSLKNRPTHSKVGPPKYSTVT